MEYSSRFYLTNVKIRILIDELDVAWKARQEQISSLSGLLSAVMRMRGRLMERRP